jgi:hypothetical protein
MRTRRLGSRRRRERWDYAELFSVTLLLVWWSVMYRILWTTHGILYPYELDLGWLTARRGQLPMLEGLALLVLGLVLMNAGCLLHPRNRTRMGLALTGINAALAVTLGFAIALHTQFAVSLLAHRNSDARSASNLENELVGRWEVVERSEPARAPRFPAQVVTFERGYHVRLQNSVDPALVEVWWEVDPTAALEASFAFAGRCGLLECNSAAILSVGRATHVGARQYDPPAVVLDTFVRNPLSERDAFGYQQWAAEMPRAGLRELEFRSINDFGVERPVARVRLEHRERPSTGWDFAEELASLREDPVWR